MTTRWIAAILALLTLAGCDSGRGQARSTQSGLESAVASGATSFDFAADPAFAWEYMYVFDCYSSRASVEKALGFSWPDFSRTTIESSDSIMLVVFVQNGEVVGWFEQPRRIELGYLTDDNNGYARYSRSEAVFDIVRSKESIRLELRTPATAPATAPESLAQVPACGGGIAQVCRIPAGTGGRCDRGGAVALL